LVLMVHGNHRMEDFSDSGYDYLGELLASRGFIFVSVDQNFLNTSFVANFLNYRGLVAEHDARGWLLLEHLQQWEQWHHSPDTAFHNKVDWENIALMGHSRGGEAVAVAAALNNLPYYPDNSAYTFDYNFNIRSVVALAPTDGNYRPTGRPIPLENVNYFTLHGSHDGDEFSFVGLGQYERVTFSEDNGWFKTALYIYGANHGQFNRRWGRADAFPPIRWLYNLKQLMPANQQERVAEVYISAFLEVTLHKEIAYLPLFQNADVAAEWLPDTLYINRYEDTSRLAISHYEEDIDLTTATLPGGQQRGENLEQWREQSIKLKNSRLNARTVFLAWDQEATLGEASYTIILPSENLTIDQTASLVFSMADVGRVLEWGEGQEASTDLTIELVDQTGETAHLPLTTFWPLVPTYKVTVYKSLLSNGGSEAIPQSFVFPLTTFEAENSAFDATQLKTIRFIFDKTPKGRIILDNIGLQGEFNVR
ncbi:MAG: MFS transporter, partial [Chloroflexota bacterium]